MKQRIVISFNAQNCSLGGLSFGTTGAPWETVGAGGMTCGGLESIFVDLGMIWEPYFESFLGTGANMFFVRACFHVTFCTDF